MTKRLVLVLSILIIMVFGFSLSNLKGEATTSIETTTSNLSATTSTYIYGYADRKDLINQLYEDLYPQIRAEIYDSLLASVRQNLNETIYQSIETKISEVLSKTSIGIPLDEMQLKIFEVSKLADQSVVGVTAYLGETGVSVGSAVIYDYDSINQTYYIITNQHVVDDADNYQVVFSDRSTVTANLLGYDKDVDIAVLSFRAEGLEQSLKVSPLGSSSQLTKGTLVLASGHPKGYDFYNTFTMGIVAGVDRMTEWDALVPYIQHDAAINSGNSGGPIYNINGEVIGINVAKYASEEIEGMGFAIPIDMVKNVVNSIRILNGSFTDISGSVSLNKVAVEPFEFSINSPLPQVNLTLPNQVNKGLLINLLVESGLLDNAGLKVGDLLVKIDDYSITSLYSMHQYITNNYQKGDTITLWYYQLNRMNLIFSNTLQSVTITL